MRHAGLDWLLGADETTPQKPLSDMAGRVPPNYEQMDAEQQARAEMRLARSRQRGWYYDDFNQLINAMSRPGPPGPARTAARDPRRKLLPRT